MCWSRRVSDWVDTAGHWLITDHINESFNETLLTSRLSYGGFWLVVFCSRHYKSCCLFSFWFIVNKDSWTEWRGLFRPPYKCFCSQHFNSVVSVWRKQKKSCLIDQEKRVSLHSFTSESWITEMSLDGSNVYNKKCEMCFLSFFISQCNLLVWLWFYMCSVWWDWMYKQNEVSWCCTVQKQ